jgi:hypothetical protein
VFTTSPSCLCLSCIEWLKESLSLLCKFSFNSFCLIILILLALLVHDIKLGCVILFDLLGIFVVVILFVVGL